MTLGTLKWFVDLEQNCNVSERGLQIFELMLIANTALTQLSIERFFTEFSALLFASFTISKNMHRNKTSTIKIVDIVDRVSNVVCPVHQLCFNSAPFRTRQKPAGEIKILLLRFICPPFQSTFSGVLS